MRRLIVAGALVLWGCSGEPVVPLVEPPPALPPGVRAGEVVYTVQREGRPETLIQLTIPARFETTCYGRIAMYDPGDNSRPSRTIEFRSAAGVFGVGSWEVVGRDPGPGQVLGESNHITSFTTPPTPTSGRLTVTYASDTRLDGFFNLRGGAKSDTENWVVIMSGTFSAEPLAPFGSCPG